VSFVRWSLGGHDSFLWGIYDSIPWLDCRGVSDHYVNRPRCRHPLAVVPEEEIAMEALKGYMNGEVFTVVVDSPSEYINSGYPVYSYISGNHHSDPLYGMRCCVVDGSVVFESEGDSGAS
jgi:hypothetical protein